MSSMMVSRVPYAEGVVSMETIRPPGETATASGQGPGVEDRRRRFRRKRTGAKGKETEARQPQPGEKLRPGAYLDVFA